MLTIFLCVCVCVSVCMCAYHYIGGGCSDIRVVTYTKAAIALHNYLRTIKSSVYCSPGFTDGEDGECNVIEGAWRTDDEQSTRVGHVACTSSNRKCTFNLPPPLLYTRHSKSAASIRDSYRDYFTSSQGEVSWQYTHVRRTQ